MKKIVSCLFILAICLFQLQNVSAQSIQIQLHSQFAYLYDRETDLVYYEKKSDEKIFPASMTKIVTVSLALEKIDNLLETVTIQASDLKGLAESHATVAGFYAGEQVTYEDLIYGALLPSGADACYALARLTYGSQSNMVAAMNQRVNELNLKNTHFMNVTGLHDEKHYTTVHEMAILLNSALSNPEFVKVFEARKHTSSKGNHQWISSLQRGKEYKNIDIGKIDGGKSGFTDEAQLTFASTMTIDHHQVILVTAYAKGQYTQNNVQDAATVCQYMNDNFHQIIFYKKDEEIQNYWIKKSLDFQYNLKAPEEISILCEKNITKSDIDLTIDSPTFIEAPIQKGDSLGNITFQYDNQTLYNYSLQATEMIESSILAVFLYYFVLFGIPLLIIIFIIRRFIRKRRTSL